MFMFIGQGGGAALGLRHAGGDIYIYIYTYIHIYIYIFISIYL